MHWAGIGIGIALIGLAFLFRGTDFFFFFIGIGFIMAFIPFVLTTIKETREANEKEEMFLEFSRNLVESVKSGNPINKSIINVRNKSYGALSPHVKKLANQISIGIPLRHALRIFSKDVNNNTISRALTLIGQAEKAGGNIGEILESVSEAVSMSDKLKKERISASSGLIGQGYIIFFIFIIIILVMQFRILPLISEMTDMDIGGMIGGIDPGAAGMDPQELSSSFLILLLVQGFFAGLTIGELSEGNVKAGIRHSFILMVLAFLVSTIANIIWG